MIQRSVYNIASCLPGKILWVSCLVVTFFLIQACDKDDIVVNPFDNIVSTQDTVRFDLTDPDPNTIAGIFINIFHPTCGNVGCHDGTFEPDFRTLESSYNTLVYQEPIKNDGNYTYRVHPGDAEMSIIMARLHGTVDPPMPIQIEPDSDWAVNRLEYIENIRTWIEAGAPDIMGNTPPADARSQPKLMGVFAVQNDVVLDRKNNSGTILLESDTLEVKLYFAFKHDDMSARDFEYNKISFSEGYNQFEDAEKWELTVDQSAVFERGMFGEFVPFYHSVVLDPRDLFNGSDQLFFRTFVKDQFNPLTEIPTDDGIYAIKEYMSFSRGD